MEKRKKIFSVFETPEPSAGLARRIMGRIERRERRILFAKMAGFGACVMGSLSLAGFGFVDAATGLSHSGFFSFASLIFSDFSSTISNFPDFIFSVMESIPTIPIAFLLGGATFFFWSASRFIKELPAIHAHQFSITT